MIIYVLGVFLIGAFFVGMFTTLFQRAMYLLGNQLIAEQQDSTLQEKYTKLQHKYQILKKDLTTSKQQQKEFTDYICHEVRTPLNIISVHSDLLNNHLQNESSGGAIDLEVMKEYIQAITSAALQQKEIINHSLNLSKWEQGKFELNITSFNLKEVFRSTQRTFSQLLSQKELSLDLELPPTEEIWVESDETFLRQLLNNLISNAIKFTPVGAGPIVLRLTHTEVNNAGEDIMLTVTVKDNGMGMSARDKQQLFNRFSQANPSIGAKFGGSGLGLVLSKYITNAMGGDIKLLESKENEGSTFQFTVRCKTCLPKKSERKNNLPDVSLKATPLPKKILIVDDESLSRLATSRQLEQLGYGCQIAKDGKEAIELSKKSMFDIIFMDMQMPGLNGIETTQKIRQVENNLKRSPAARIIGLSASPIEGISENECIQNGMNAYLMKPCKITRLQQEIEAEEPPQSTLAQAWPRKSPPVKDTRFSSTVLYQRNPSVNGVTANSTHLVQIGM